MYLVVVEMQIYLSTLVQQQTVKTTSIQRLVFLDISVNVYDTTKQCWFNVAPALQTICVTVNPFSAETVIIDVII